MTKRTEITETDYDKLLQVFKELNTCNVWSRVKRNDFTIKRFE